jgi:methyl-accepting chemotaxis protein
MRSYYFKNFITMAALVLLSFLILSACFVIVGRNYALRERRDTIESNAIELSRLASAYAQDGTLEDWSFRITLSTVARSTGNLCFVSDCDGRVVTCSDISLNCGHVGQQLPDTVMDSLREKHYFSGLCPLFGAGSASSYVAALPVVSQTGEVLAYVFAVSSVSGVVEAWRSILNIFLMMSLIIMAAALILGFISAKVRAKPINEMADAALKFAHGDFSARVSAGDRDDEIGALAASFNLMAESLE